MRTLEWLAQYEFARQALITAFAIGAVCSLLSVVVVLKRMAFIGQGISHAGFGGIGAALFLGLTEGLAQDAVVLAFCLLSAVVIAAMSRRKRVEADTAIGVILVGAMALGVFLARLNPQPVSYDYLLFGSISNVTAQDSVVAVVVALLVVGTCALLFKEIVFFTFDEGVSRVFGVPTTFIYYLLLSLLTLVIVVSMKLAGVVLVSALLVIPGATAVQLSRRLGPVLLLSLGVGLLGSVGGLVLSFELGDFPSGPCIVGILCGLFVLAFVGRGLTGRFKRAA